MRLATRLFLSGSLLAVVPVVAAALLTARFLTERFEADFEHRVRATSELVRSEWDQKGEDLAKAVGRLPETGRLMGQVAVMLSTGESDGGAIREAPRTMAALGLDVLTVAAPDGRVLAAGHLPGLAGTKVTLPAPGGGPRLVKERIRGKAGTIEVPAVVVVRALTTWGEGKVTVLGGHRLGPDFVRRLLPGGRARLVLRGADGKEIASAGPKVDGPSRRIKLGDGPGKARLVLTIDRSPLVRTVDAVTRTAAVVGGAAVIVALLASLLIAGRLAKPLSELAGGVRSVAAGNLDERLPERGPREVRQVTEAFNRMTADLNESRLQLRHIARVAAWRDVARRIAHEVKNPLSPIRTAMETLRLARRKGADGFDELLEESTDTVLEEVERLNRMVTAFGDFARMPPPEPEHLDLGATVRDALRLAGLVPEGIHLEQELADGVAVRADRDQLTRVVTNLVKNAAEALGDAGGRVRVVVARDARERPTLTVEDNGPGLPAAVADDPFAPYATTKEHGTGLGLAEVQRIAVDHGGEARCSTVEGGGCRFDVVLPSDP